MRRGAAVTGSFGVSLGGGYGGGYDLEALTRATEAQVEAEMHKLGALAELKTVPAPSGFLDRPLPPAAQAALAALCATVVEGVAVPEGGGARLPPAGDHACARRSMVPRQPCPLLHFSAASTPFNSSCPITLCDFDEGEPVRRLPGG